MVIWNEQQVQHILCEVDEEDNSGVQEGNVPTF